MLLYARFEKPSICSPSFVFLLGIIEATRGERKLKASLFFPCLEEFSSWSRPSEYRADLS